MSDATCVVLVIDSDLATVDCVERSLDGLCVAVVRATDLASGAIRHRRVLPNVILLDSSLDKPQVPLHDLFGSDFAVDIVLMVSDSTVLSQSEATARGVSAILNKPLNPAQLRGLVSGFIAQAETRRHTSRLDDELLDAYQFQGMVGRSPAMLQLFSKVRRAAPLFQTLLVTGPTGTGKELLAHALHNLSSRSKARFVPCNCSALVETLAESQLFGHVKGAFTGASEDTPGLFEYANHGTVFLDEIGDLPLSAQAKLLRVLQNRELQRLGSPKTHTLDVHVIAATNRDLRESVAEGKFREDLFFRLSMVELRLPSLAERKEDLPLLQRHFLHLYSARYGKPTRGFSRQAQLLMSNYSWPGNVRELENVIGNACMMAQSEVITDSDLPESIRCAKMSPLRAPGLITLQEVQARHLWYVLSQVGGNKARAAEVLGVSRAQVYHLLSRFRSQSGMMPSVRSRENPI